MRAPNGDGFINAITTALKPWACPEAEVLAKVGELVTLLCKVVPEHFTREAIIKTREGARELNKTIDKLEKQLSRIQRHSPELRIRLPLIIPDFLRGLGQIRKACKEAEQAATKEDRRKRICVGTAIFLIEVYSTKAPTIMRTCEIAGWLYEAVTGEETNKTDFRWVCLDVLKQRRSKKI
jgi:hypothetical protein